MIEEIVLKRLTELVTAGEAVISTKFEKRYSIKIEYYVDNEKFVEWAVNCLNILERALTIESIHYKTFDNVFQQRVNKLGNAKACLAALRAAKSDFENGYLFNTRSLIEAEVFDDFL